ncbi:Lrp/AsnC family transcriptional regulator [Neptunicella marina]|uniref:Lrp/AsnC family transcriptional regulator n=1 Tax=Neptunicella marina TaxID=2125989 RepID=A0A8J6INB7_9ALTE|nr:Lrp/AsnC family transcriptional regulator [Neptunicella marina]MBC3765175.1 Lrp/AsnC family transcriptional regulator [Neptunicella marina]
MSRPLDSTDLTLLAELFVDARITNKDLAQIAGLSPSSCLERVKRLQADGVILGSGVQLNVNALGGHIQAMISVRLSSHSRDIIGAFQQDMLTQKEVLGVFHMGGEDDFLVHITVSDTAHLRDFIFNAITGRSEVNHVETSLVYDYQISKRLPSF